MAQMATVTDRKPLSAETKRVTRKPRFPFGVSMPTARLTPINMQMVLPGETMVSQRHQLRLVSEPVKKVVNPAYVELYSFYVPFRLAVGNLWPAFVEQEGFTIRLDQAQPAYGYAPAAPDVGGGTPIINQEAPKFGFKNNAGSTRSRNTLVEQCAEAVYNYWFKYQDAADANFAYGKSDNLPRLAHVDQLGEATPVSAYPATAVSVASNQFYVIDLKRAEDKYRKELNQSLGDPRYPEIMGMYGVDFPGELIVEPELLLKRRNFIYPSRTVGEVNGNIVGQFQHDMEVELERPYMFREHGLVMNFIVLRPEVLLDKYGPLPGFLREPNHFIMPGQADFTFGFTAADKEWTANATFDNVDLSTLMHLGEHFVGDVEPVGGKTTPFAIAALGSDPQYPTTADSDHWDLTNFQFTGGTDTEKLRRVAWATGVSSFRIKTLLRAGPNNRTLDRDRR